MATTKMVRTDNFFTAALVAVAASNHGMSAAHSDRGNPISMPTSSHRRRRVLITRDEDVTDRIRSGMVDSTTNHFDIEAETDTDGYSSIMLHVDKMEPAVTSRTTFIFECEGGDDEIANDADFNGWGILASNPRDNGEITTLSVDTKSGHVRGIQRGNGGEILQLSVDSSSGDRERTRRTHNILRATSKSHLEHNFTCGVDHKVDEHDGYFLDNHDHHHHHHHERSLSLFDDYLRHRGTNYSALNTGELAVKDTRAFKKKKPGFTINMLVAIDEDLIRKQGNRRSAIEYVNFLISSANVIFNDELNAHINVVKVEETKIFSNLSTLREGLKAMRQNYQGKFGVGDDVNLVHAILGRDIGGGIAFVDTVCDSTWGVGLSSGINGKINDLDDDALHDSFMVAHEIGHSFGSGHTFDGYSPPIDSCTGKSCPAGLPRKNSATLMSYCNFCSGGLDNIAMSLGGVWDREGERSSVNSWQNRPSLAGSVSYEPKRVAHQIWTSLSAKGECISNEVKTKPPSYAPSLSPINPTAAPSTSPPTKSPSASPTLSFDPTPQPSDIPSVSRAPTGSPSTSPTLTHGPSLHPSASPSTSEAPTAVPSPTPSTSKHPSVPPSAKPSIQQSTNPSEVPSVSLQPSNQPSSLPSISPSNSAQPSDNPSSSPSDTPTATASPSISQIPSISPTVEPSFAPSVEPSAGPSVSRQPSSLPSQSPTISAAPSVHPSEYLSSSPSTLPSLAPSFSPTPLDLGPFSVSPDRICDDGCSKASGFMLRVKNRKKATRDVIINGISFEHTAHLKSGTVELYFTDDTYFGKEQNSADWQLIASLEVSNSYSIDELVLETPILLQKGESAGFFLKAKESIILVSEIGNDVRRGNDGRVQLNYGNAMMGSGLLSTVSEGYSWNGAVSYSTSIVNSTSGEVV